MVHTTKVKEKKFREDFLNWQLKNKVSDFDKEVIKGIKIIAKKYKKWILIGSVIIKISKTKLVNRSVLIDNNGKIRTFYDKIHMYDVVLSKREKYFESKTFSAGEIIAMSFDPTSSPSGNVNMTMVFVYDITTGV